MMRAWRSLVALTRMELLRLLRTRELWTRMMLPAMLWPLAVIVVALVVLFGVGTHMFATGSYERVVALSHDTPDELPVATEFEADGWRVLWVDDPKQAVEEGHASLGVGPFVPGPGLGTRHDERVDSVVGLADRPWVPSEDRFLWTVSVWETERRSGDADDPLVEVEATVFEGRLAAQGLASRRFVAVFLEKVGIDAESDGKRKAPTVLFGHQLRFGDFIQCLVVCMGGGVGYLVLLFTTLADRQAGIFETQATMAVRPGVVLLSRALAMVILLLAACLLCTLPVYGFERLRLEEARLPLELLGETLSFCVVVAALVLPIAVLARSGQEAYTVGGCAVFVAMTIGCGMVVLPLWMDLAGAFAALTVCILGLDALGALNHAAVVDR